MDGELQCDLLSIFHNISTNRSNDIEVAQDECKVICIISIMKGIEVCSEYLFDSGLLNQLKDLIQYCVYKSYAVEQ
jgi:hypothetical protein